MVKSQVVPFGISNVKAPFARVVEMRVPQVTVALARLFPAIVLIVPLTLKVGVPVPVGVGVVVGVGVLVGLPSGVPVFVGVGVVVVEFAVVSTAGVVGVAIVV